MKRLGVSIYVDQAPKREILSYLSKAAANGFSRVFTCLISAAGESEEFLEVFKEVTAYAASLGMEVIADVDPSVFEKLNISITDLSFFKSINLSGIRLDLGFSGQEEALMTYNEYGIKIELNMSSGNRYVENILSYKPNAENLYGCHNFYPHVYTGISRTHFLTCSEQFRKLNIKTAAFVSSESAEFGPWPVSEGLCTLESHRTLPITTQAKDLFSSGLIDDVIIGNMFASDVELEALGKLDRNMLYLEVEFQKGTTELERKIVLEEPHFVRGDVSEYLLRSTQSRVKYKGESFPPHDNEEINPGDVIVESDLYKRYAGELQIALKSMKNSGKSNKVAVIKSHELYLIDTLLPWQSFRFIEKK
ncbi:MupG family TIM beta-alpha barrel fold protein [Fusibacter bizertensis]|uniref:MupG family TIM beta-alpha barrel fold protein n=1 Tax=Fusibacter bizertensis TaxID=1488331 RepID=A0ABT6NBU8_9FIRM|nr:MupG family TIM beta-alpha barrel fold protein [Fusibacter bizertensis]MDH8677892.1 MupG family TIM beta-alpha barrel fold protein [Fusibacter bizertensis]